MKRLTRSLLSLALCLTVALSLCVTFTDTADAASLTTVKSGGTIKVADFNADDSDAPAYQTETISSSDVIKYTLKLPSSSGSVIILLPEGFASSIMVNGKSCTDTLRDSEDGVSLLWQSFPVSSNTATLELVPQSALVGIDEYQIPFSLSFAPSNPTISPGKTEYMLGSTGKGATSVLTVKAPGKGYLEISAGGGFDASSAVQIKAPGFKSWESLASKQAFTTRIGVKKGSYKISIKGNSSVRNVVVTYHSVKETSVKTSKSKAATLKKNKVNKGLVITNAKKVHWYKIRNPKKQKMTLKFDTSKLGGGSSSGGKLRFTIYYPNNTKIIRTISPRKIGTYTISYGTSGSKADKGTYYVKVESVGGANGYYTMVWK